MSLSKLLEMVKDTEAWSAAVHQVAKSWTRLTDQHTALGQTAVRCVSGFPAQDPWSQRSSALTLLTSPNVSHTDTHTHRHRHTHTDTHTQTHTQTQTQTHRHTHTDTHTDTHTQTHTDTHTQMNNQATVFA